jgi:hypothetical protein
VLGSLSNSYAPISTLASEKLMIAVTRSSWLLLRSAAARALNRFSLLRESFVEARQARTRIEAELFRGRYYVSSKNDDDLPIVR